ncbi:MAG: carbamoyltransferase HypF [Syntrophotaleaceae bacterium]
MNSRLRVRVQGIVQGVGFRPFVYRLAVSLALRGWVMNTPGGVVLEVQGPAQRLEQFVFELRDQAPPLAVINAIQSEEIEPVDEEDFVIHASGGSGDEVQIAPDGDVCKDCLTEMFDPADRRFRYPFINCTNCGPRYSIVRGVPYDRPLTTMADFDLCQACLDEYRDPLHRRFHAQPIACPECGPQLRLQDNRGQDIAGDPLETAVDLLRQGRILAVKGLGGYQLAVDAVNQEAVAELRRRKRRDQKPFALMVSDLEAAEAIAECDATAARLLQGPERPIVLLPKRPLNVIAPLVAPGNGYFGVMLPCTPLHHLLLRGRFGALVMTSGNLSDEPICYRDQEALARLAEIADAFLSHNRAIHVRSDDSVIRVFRGQPVFLRRARGYAPRPVTLPAAQKSVLAVGAELKGTICLTRGDQAFVSQHLGDLRNTETLASLEETAKHLQRILKIDPQVVVHDLHPDYLSTGYAEVLGELPKLAVQHHHAHLASCMAEHRLEGEVIGVIFDGTGFGSDGTIWGGEFLVGGYRSFERSGYLRPLPLPGGDAAVRQPWRMALSWLYRLFGSHLYDLNLPCTRQLSPGEESLFLQMLEKGINAPLTSSCGRLFDAVASLLDLRQQVAYEGQAAIELEALAETAAPTGEPWPFAIVEEAGYWVLDFAELMRKLLEEQRQGAPQNQLARRFHHSLAAAAGDLCEKVRAETGLERVVLSGGVFQNRLLTEELCHILEDRKFRVYTQRLVPPNDGGLALGQAVIAGRSELCV